jgi:hypothetical protein
MAETPNFDTDKVDEMTLALLSLVMFRQGKDYPLQAWKSFDWGTMDRLFEKGLISDPKGKAKSVVMTDEGARLAKELFKKHFGKAEA